MKKLINKVRVNRDIFDSDVAIIGHSGAVPQSLTILHVNFDCLQRCNIRYGGGD